MTDITRKERDEISLLLPWHAAGRLDPAETARVEQALRIDAALRSEYEIVREDRDAAIELAESDEIPASMPARFNASLEKLLADAAKPADAARRRAETAGQGLLARLLDAFAPRGRMAYAAVAAALLIAVQAGTIFALLADRRAGPAEFETVTKDSLAADSALFVLVRFADGATAAALQAWLESNRARIVDGPLPGGMFRLRLPQDAAGSATELAERLKAEAGIVALALPAN